MNRRNYVKELDKIIEQSADKKPKLLLHVCCGPCSTSVLEFLNRYFDITVLWFNPNLYPEEEFNKRLDTLKEVLNKMSLSDSVKILEEERQHDKYLEIVTDELKKEPEGGKRCRECFRLRLFKTAKVAAEKGYDYFCTTLTVSRHKDAVAINEIGEEAAKKYGSTWLPSDFKKRNGEMRSQILSEELEIYRQLYCGCEFSLYKRENKDNNQ